MLVCPTALHFIFFFSHFRGLKLKKHIPHTATKPTHTLKKCAYTPAMLPSTMYTDARMFTVFSRSFFFPFFFSSSLFFFFFAFYKGWFGELGNRNLQFWRELSVWHGCVGEYISWLGGLHIDKVSCFSFSFFPFFKIYTSGLYIIIYSPPF